MLRVWAPRFALLATVVAAGCAHRPARPENGLTDEQLLEVLRDHVGDVTACQNTQREAAPLSMTVTVFLEVQPDGSTSDVHTNSSVAATAGARCLVRTARTWRFPAFEGEAIRLDFPVVFSARRQ